MLRLNPLRWLVLLAAWVWRRPLLWWVRARVVPDPPSDVLGDQAHRAVCYVLPVRSWADRTVVESVLREQGMALPYLTRQRLPTPERAALLYLPALADLDMRDSGSELRKLVDAALDASDYEIDLVPVSVYWGRDPGKETSLLRILFTDSWQAGWLRKFFIVLANGRNALVSFSKPVAFRQFMDADADRAARLTKLARVMRVHFRRNRDAVLGPSRSNRATLIRGLLNHPNVRGAMDQAVAEGQLTRQQATAKAERYGNEIAADYAVAAVRFMEVVLDWLWARIFDGLDVYNVEAARTAAHDGGVVYVPSHRSHFDYLLVSYVLYKRGLAPPHIAAGINMNFWPVGGLLRRCGAFYLRRSFKGNKLYAAVFRAYVDALITRGTPVSFYPEGGRSRTGRLRRPMTGMLSMITESALRNPDQPVKLVPIFLGYDRIMEVGSYFGELRGQKIKRESAAGLIKARRLLKRRFGRPYIAFGEPMDVRACVDARHADWAGRDWSSEARPDGWAEFIRALGVDVMRRINATAVVSPVAVTAVALLATQQRAMAADELADRLGAFVALLELAPYSGWVSMPETNGQALMDRAEPIAGLQRVQHPWGDLVLAKDKDAVLLTYYRNSIQHLFALPSLVANFFASRLQRERAQVHAGCRALYPILRDEWFLVDAEDGLDAAVDRQIDAMIRLGMLHADGDSLRRPPPSEAGFGHLNGLMRVMRETLERYAMTLVLLSAHGADAVVNRESFESDCHLMAERMAVLTGRNAPEFFDPALFRGHVTSLIARGLLGQRDSDAEADGGLQGDAGAGNLDMITIGSDIEPLARQALELLGPDIAQTVLHLSGRWHRGAEGG